ncbi:hypothetical protein B0T26DRAFT_650218 [Lasiosphaeria miniovina]|uniref:NAD(P)-binding domain-containing protein n=1 Tax=Lasiosphaeria miniovina TaxID=1954250 RepID=A0AA40ADP4_9PEZI|nr:uncharacterized protein B0T26DRAFT_650218 [Lasiosphaeria miniovina]KAK0713999.1 hypothetical protein B0T26DRAFT_650218 [Lasiosphaeria miniovina]
MATSAAAHHVLVLGGHGKIAQLLTPLLLQRGWAVTSVIRSSEQVAAIEKLGDSRKGRLSVLVRSIEDVKSEAQARAVLEEAGRPDYVVWSAGAAGKGGPERTFAIDRDAAVHFIRASAAPSSGVTRFLLVSYNCSRRTKPAWWDGASWTAAQEINSRALKTYYAAKVVADEALYAASKGRTDGGFVGIDLRPGTLSDEPAWGVELGKTKGSAGKVSRASVARVADQLLAADGVKNSWIDMLDGDEEISAAAKRVVEEGVNAAEGESVF